MNLRLGLLAGVLLLVLSTIAAACGGDEKPTLEEFFRQADAIDDDYLERFDRLPDEYPEPDLENFQEYKAFFGEYAVLFTDFIDELENLNPPSEAENAFTELLTAGGEYGEGLQELGSRIGGAESLAEAEQFLGEGVVESGGRYRLACHSLQEVAAAHGIVVRFDCGIPDHPPSLVHLARALSELVWSTLLNSGNGAGVHHQDAQRAGAGVSQHSPLAAYTEPCRMAA